MKSRLGGLARRGTYIEQLREKGTPILHLDAGDAFQTKYAVSEADRKQVDAAAQVYLDAFSAMGVAAYNIGDRDLALGVPTLLKLAERAKFPFLSANVVKDGKPVFRPSTVVQVAGYRIAVIGVVTTLFVNRTERQTKDGIEITDPAQAVKAQVARHLANGVKLFAVLAHLNDDEIEKVAAANPEVQFILGGQSTRMQRLLKTVDGAFVVNGYMRGKNVSVLDLFVSGDSLTFVDRDARESLERHGLQLERQISSRERSIEQARADPARARSTDYLERNLVQLKTELQEVGLDLEELKDPPADTSWVRWELAGMTTAYTDHEAIARQVAAYRAIYPDPTKKKKGPAARTATRSPAVLASPSAPRRTQKK